MTVDFQLVVPVAGPTGAHLVPRPVARVVLSPTHAKVLAEIIRRSVVEWEERFGTLPDVAALMPRPPEESQDAANTTVKAGGEVPGGIYAAGEPSEAGVENV